MKVLSLLIDGFFQAEAADFAVTEIVFREGMPLVLKGSGNMVTPTPDRLVGHAQMDEMLQAISPDYLDIIQRHGQLEMRYEVDVDSGDSDQQHTRTLRVTGLTYDGGDKLSVIMRINADEAWPIDALNLPEIAEGLIRDLKPGGMLLVAGPMASGKSTTMYAAVDLLNTHTPQTIVTIEDPIETRLNSRKGLIIQREVCPYGRENEVHSAAKRHDARNGDGTNQRFPMGDVPDFITGVRGAMRQSLNGMLIMEIRDAETADAALRAAEAGLWVIAGIHASEAVGALERLVNFAPAEQRADRSRILERRLHGVLFQKLVPNATLTASVLAVEVIYPAASTPQGVDKFKTAFNTNNVSALQDLLQASDTKQDLSPDVLSLNRSLLTLTLAGSFSKKAAFAASYDVPGLKELFSRHDRAGGSQSN